MNVANSVNSTVVKPKSIQLIKIRVENVNDGTAILPQQKINDLEIPECLIQVKNNEAFTTASNSSEKEVVLDLSDPIKVISSSEFEVYEKPPNNLNLFDTSKLKFDLSKLRLNHLNPEEKKEITKIIKSYSDIFHNDNQPLTFTNTIKHQIKLKDDTPIHSKTYRYPYIHKEEVNKQISKMLEQGIIRPSQSAFSAPIWIVPKRMDASGQRKWRIVVDYRKLNDQSISDRYPIPNINDILDKLGKSQYFTTLDLASGFHQIEVDPKDTEKTAFSVENGHYEFVRMPFGLKNAPSTFQRVMDNVLRGLQHEICIVYLDDIILFSTSLQEHIEKLKLVFERLRQSNFKLQLDKCEFLRKEVTYLGHIITPNGIKPNPEKIKAILDYPIPKTPKQLKGFLGLLGYYRKFIRNFAKLTKPLTICLKKDRTINVNDEAYTTCFEFCKKLLTNEPILQYPNFEEPFVLTCDASQYAVGSVLSQGPIGSDLPICYASRTLNEHEINYSTIEKELLAIVWATKYFRPYLYGRKFKIVTDHKPLQYLFSLKDANSKLCRWRLRLEEYDYEIVYKKGKLNSNADALSRPPNLNILQSSSDSDDNLPILEYMKKFNAKLENKENNCEELSDNVSIIAEPPDPSDQDDVTIHTSAENPICDIPISEDPLNFGANQIHFISVKTNPQDTRIQHLFNNTKQRFIVQIPEDKCVENLFKFIKEFVTPKINYSCYFDNDLLFYQFNSVVSEHFNNTLKFKKCNKILSDIELVDEQQALIKNYHEGKTNHRGITETLLKLSSQNYFPNMQKHIQTYINNCDICKVVKYDRRPLKLKFNITPTPSKPFEIVHVDILTYENNKFLTIIDAFSKYAQVYLIDTSQTVEVVEKLLIFFSHHSIPGLIVADNGPEFDSGLFREFLTLHKINLHLCSPHHPASNGLIERFHSTFLDHLNILSTREEFKKDSLKIKALLAVIAYNNSIHTTTKLTPFDILNYDMQQPVEIDLETQIVNNFVQNHKEKIKSLYEIINDRLATNKTKLISKLNENREDVPEIPENVFVKSNFRSKQRNKYKKEQIVSTDPKMKTFSPVITKSKTGRKFKKLHMANIKRPTKTNTSNIPGSSSSNGR